MDNQQHRIFRLRLDFSMPEEEEPTPIQDRMSALIQRALIPIMEDLFSEFSSSNSLTKLNQLELDIGKISIEKLEEQLPLKLEEVLRLKLSQLLEFSEKPTENVKKKSVSTSLLEAFKIFLQKGAYPWWIPLHKQLPPKNLLHQLARTDPAGLVSILRTTGHLPEIIRRLVLTFDDSDLRLLIGLLIPKYPTFIKQVVQDVSFQHQRSATLKISHRDFRNVLWELVFTAVLRQPENQFEQLEFLKRLLFSMANKFGKSDQAGIKALANMLLRERGTKYLETSLMQLYSQVLEEKGHEVSRVEEVPDWLDRLLLAFSPEERLAIKTKLSGLGVEKWNLPPFRKIGVRSWQTIIRRLWELHPAAVRRLIQGLVQSGKHGELYLFHFPTDVSQKFLTVYHSVLADYLIDLEQDISTLSQRNAIPNWTSRQLQKTIFQHYLTHLSGETAQWLDYSKLMKSLLQKLALLRNLRFEDWLLSLLDIVAISGKEQLSSDLPHFINALAIENGLVARTQNPGRIEKEILQGESNQLNTELYQDILIVQHFFESEHLPPGTSLAQLRKLVIRWQQHSPLSLKMWLRRHLQESTFQDRLTTYLPRDLSIALLNVLHFPAGAYALQLYQYLEEARLLETVEIQAGKPFWRTVWTVFGAHASSNTFNLHVYISGLLQELALESNSQLEDWLEVLGDTISEEITVPQKILRTIIITQQWHRAIVETYPEAALLPAHRLAWLIDIVMVFMEKAGNDTVSVPENDPVALFGRLLKDKQFWADTYSEQQQALTQLSKELAASQGMTFEQYLERMVSILQTLGPAFKQGLSSEIFNRMIHANLRSDLPIIDIGPAPNTLSRYKENELTEKERKYRKLWEKEDREPQFDEVWLVANAGMVLLWPYLGVFFERAGLMEAGRFIDEQHQQKAVYLLEYLVSGEITTDEYRLVLNKLFCGWPMEHPLEVDFKLDDNFTDLCEGLLAAVISHWPVIGEISVEALRETFLMREGNLARNSKGWWLQVPQKSYDILLSQLPWGISVVNLSWVGEVIEVKWV